MAYFSSIEQTTDPFPEMTIARERIADNFASQQTRCNLRAFERVFVPRGDTLLYQGATSSSVFYILSGWALEEQINCDGEIAWTHINLRGEIAGINSVSFEPLGDGQTVPVATAFIHALTDVYALNLPRAKFMAEAEDDRALGPLIRDILRQQSASLHNHLVALSAKSSGDRILQIVRTLHARALQQGAISRADCRLPISQVLMAKFANISVVHLNRIAQKLRQDGLLDWNGDGVCLLGEGQFAQSVSISR
jgi:CRP-like cAMP-binding protein